jgi:membrane protein implicated in regulation of membrane protease activity
MIALWLLAALAAGIVEVLVPAFGFLFVALAALVTGGAAWLGIATTGQVVLFAATSLLSLLLLRPLLVSKRVGGKGVPSRTEALLGRLGHVTEAIDPVRGTGRINVGGEDWAARSASAVAAGARVRVDGADGIVLIVSAARSPE